MDAPYCEVIGCTARAQWFLVSEHNGATEEQYLCQRHWRQRMHDLSRRTIRWMPATARASVEAANTAAPLGAASGAARWEAAGQPAQEERK